MSTRHKTFISFHHDNDKYYKNQFEQMFVHDHNIFVNRSVGDEDIPDELDDDRVRQLIRENYLRDTTVTLVLIGKDSWKRRHIDWEIGSSIRETAYNPRSGLLGIFLPSHGGNPFAYNKYTIPPRLSDNVDCGFAKLYDWSLNPNEVKGWIHEAFLRRNLINPINTYPHFKNNRTGIHWQ